MFFTKLGTVIAWVAFIIGVVTMAQGFLLAASDMSREEIAGYIGSRTTGQMIDKGMYYALFGVGFGILTEMCKAVAKKAKETGNEA